MSNPRKIELSPGLKDGREVVFSRNAVYIALEVSSGEMKQFVKFLPAYEAHVKENPQTLLMKIVGAHKAEHSHFLVYINPKFESFPGVRSVTYDIKKKDRTAPPATRGNRGDDFGRETI